MVGVRGGAPGGPEGEEGVEERLGGSGGERQAHGGAATSEEQDGGLHREQPGGEETEGSGDRPSPEVVRREREGRRDGAGEETPQDVAAGGLGHGSIVPPSAGRVGGASPPTARSPQRGWGTGSGSGAWRGVPPPPGVLWELFVTGRRSGKSFFW